MELYVIFDYLETLDSKDGIFQILELLGDLDNEKSKSNAIFWAWYYKSLALDNLGGHNEARECYDIAIKIDPNLAALGLG